MSAARTLAVSRSAWEDRVALLEDERVVEVEIEQRGAETRPGDVYVARLRRIVPGLDAAFLDLGSERPAYLPLPSSERAALGALRRGQSLLVQIVKAPLGGKGARLSARPILTTRHWVLNAGGRGTAISRKIVDAASRDRLRAVADEVAVADAALVVRTSAVEATSAALADEARRLIEHWRSLERLASSVSPPSRLHAEPALPMRWIRDRLAQTPTRVVVSDAAVADELRALLPESHDGDASSLTIEVIDADPFSALRVDEALRAALARSVRLPSGGHVTIDATRALTAIDVDTGRFVGTRALSETIVTTNLEAAREIARQLRLRNLGGIVVIDFIDMRGTADRERVLDVLREECARDPEPIEILPFTPLGLVQLTRKRTRPALAEQLLDACPSCDGTGRVPASAAVGARVLRALEARATEPSRTALVARAAPPVAEWLRRDAAVAVAAIERRLGRTVLIRSDERTPTDAFVVEPPPVRNESGASPGR